MTKKISEYLMAYEPGRENEDAIYKQKYAYFTHKHYRSMQCLIGSSF
jgi:hypothetical protein